jgi:hypothetical protein
MKLLSFPISMDSFRRLFQTDSEWHRKFITKPASEEDPQAAAEPAVPSARGLVPAPFEVFAAVYEFKRRKPKTKRSTAVL